MAKILGFLFFLIGFQPMVFAQEDEYKFAAGIGYGFGSEVKNRNYTYTNRYLKGQLFYNLKTTKHVQFEVLLQPEINFAAHQLLNLYFVTPEEANYQAKRAEYTQLKDIREYVMHVGFVVRKPFSDRFSVYVLGSIGPMFTDTETERLSKGFAFSDVLALGISYRHNKVIFDLRPNLRHTSNAGLQNSNAGFNTFNVEFGVILPL